MKRVEQETASNSWSDDILNLCSDNSFYFTAFRAYVILEGHGRVQSTSVPYIHRIWFLPLILGYVVGKRILGILSRSKPQLSGHVFCCNSAAPYKTEAFFELVNEFHDADKQTTLFGVSDALDAFHETGDNDDVNKVSFGGSFTTVSPVAVIRVLPHLWRKAGKMGDVLEIESRRRRIIAFNFLVTEFIKYDGIKRTDAGIDTFHTYAPMPYQLEAINHHQIYVYQHGIEADMGDRAFSIPKYAQVTYFVWGDAWVDKFERKSHPDSEVFPVGTPRYDALYERRKERDVDIDVLFVSGSHVIDNEEYDNEAYHELVDGVVEMCKERGWRLAIKLHPIENADQYEQWGYDNYITDEDNISDLLLRSDVAVTDLSSSFTESLVLGTPMVVTQSSQYLGLSLIHI